MEHYSVIKTNEVLTYGTTWIDFENIMPSKKKARHRNFILYDTIYMKCLEQTARRLTVASLGDRE